MTDPALPLEESVRRLLAAARHDEPAPAEVVARLDATLAELSAERRSLPTGNARPQEANTPDASTPADSTEGAATQGVVVDLAARRRRRAGLGLLAAAAVVVAGVGLGQILPRGGSDSVGISASEADRSSGPGDGADGSELSAPEELSEGSPGLKRAAPGAAADQDALPTLVKNDGLRRDLLSLRDAPLIESRAETSSALAGCATGDLGAGRQLRAMIDDEPGVVVFRPARRATQSVAVYVCGEAAPVRTVSLPAP